jgi:glycosyltransferase involved in cell wall biosynthesis
MHIALYFPGRLPVRGAGGTQRVVLWLARGLAELGHTVSLLALRGTWCRYAQVVPLERSALQQSAFDVTRWVPPSADLLHSHVPLSQPPRVPHLFTWHGNARPGTALPPNVVFVSEDHARRHGREAFVYNGLELSEYRFQRAKESYHLFIGRLRTAKGWRWAIEGARRADRPIVLAGGWRPSLRRGIRFVGAVDGERKARLLAGARCLWMPAQWAEPFGLTLIEAMASGTPVLGTRRGALPEIVDAATGRLADTLDELVALVPAVEALDPEACRERVERCFTHRSMAESYLRMYAALKETGALPAGVRHSPPSTMNPAT